MTLARGQPAGRPGSPPGQPPTRNSQTGTFLLRATLDNPNGTLRPNQFVRARIHGFVRANAFLVPQRAVQQGAKGHFAWVVGTERKVEPRPVTLADWYGNDVFVSDGLRPGDQVVVDGGLTLRPGDVVAPKPLAVPAALGAPTATPPAPSAAPPASSGPAAPTKPEPPKAAR